MHRKHVPSPIAVPDRENLSHVELYVSDLDWSAEFWGWLRCELGYVQYQM